MHHGHFVDPMHMFMGSGLHGSFDAGMMGEGPEMYPLEDEEEEEFYPRMGRHPR